MGQGYKKNPKIKLGKRSILKEEDFSHKNEKLRVTAWVDGDIYDELNRRAKLGEGGGKYQTLMNQVLRQALFERTTEIEDIILRVMREKFGVEPREVPGAPQKSQVFHFKNAVEQEEHIDDVDEG
ncbi:MAG: hypothetical protein C5B49_08720 [Bdellovibrio sp.]|nr:MAG: hypothetical protein C5B49_08720 [Bdellovibrio sp.]